MIRERRGGGDPPPGAEFVRFWGHHVGRNRGDASDAFVVLIIGTQRSDWTGGGDAAASRRRVGRRCGAGRCRHRPVRLHPRGNRRPHHCAVAARLFRGGRDPADAQRRPRRTQRGAAARRTQPAAGPGRPLPGASVRGAADPDLVGRRRQPAADLGRYLARHSEGRLGAADPRLRYLAATGTGLADGPRGRCLARFRRGISPQSHHIKRSRHRGDGPRHRRPGRGAIARIDRIAARAR